MGVYRCMVCDEPGHNRQTCPHTEYRHALQNLVDLDLSHVSNETTQAMAEILKSANRVYRLGRAGRDQ